MLLECVNWTKSCSTYRSVLKNLSWSWNKQLHYSSMHRNEGNRSQSLLEICEIHGYSRYTLIVTAINAYSCLKKTLFKLLIVTEGGRSYSAIFSSTQYIINIWMAEGSWSSIVRSYFHFCPWQPMIGFKFLYMKDWTVFQKAKSSRCKRRRKRAKVMGNKANAFWA